MNTTAAVWLGSTMACAQCHNHKYDPFSQKDYYRMMAFFDNADYRVAGVGEAVMDKWIVEPELELATPEQAARRAVLVAEADRLRAEVTGKDLEAELLAFEREAGGAGGGLDTTRADPLLGEERGEDHEEDDRSLLVSGGDPRQGHLHGDLRRVAPGGSRPCASTRFPIRACPRTGRGGRARGPSC